MPTFYSPPASSGIVSADIRKDFTGNNSLVVPFNGGTFSMAVSFKLWWDEFSDDESAAIILNPNATGYGFKIIPNASNPISGNILIEVTDPLLGAGSNIYYFSRPTEQVWHHYYAILSTQGGQPISLYLDRSSSNFSVQF